VFLLRNCLRGAAAVSALGLALGAYAGGSGSAQSTKSPVSRAQAQQKLKKAASRFTENVGQWNGQARFVSRGDTVDLWVTRDGATFDFFKVAGEQRVGQVVKMSFAGARSRFASEGLRPDGGLSAYVAKAGSKAVNAKRFDEVWQRSVYPGVDVRYYLDKGQPRYDFVVAPNADPSQIALRLSGANSVRVNKGEVVMSTQVGEVRHARLFAYQGAGKTKKQVKASFKQKADGTVAFALGQFDRSKPLVIDPLVYGSYYGGEGGWDEVRSVTADLDGGVYLVGMTRSQQFPALQGPYSFNLRGTMDAFVAKLQGDAYANIYATYLGGSLSDFAQFASLDAFGNLWIAGRTASSNFPGNTRPNIQFLRLSALSRGAPNGGTYRLGYAGAFTQELPHDATAAQVEAALNALPILNGFVESVTPINGGLPFGQYRVQINNARPLQIQVLSNYDGPQLQNGPENTQGLEARYRLAVDGAANANVIQLRGSSPFGGSFQLRFVNPDAQGNLVAGTTAPIPWNATATQIQAALTALQNLNGGTFTVTGDRAFDGSIRIRFSPAANAPAGSVAISNPPNAPARQLNIPYTGALDPFPIYEAVGSTDIFVMKWNRTPNGLLDPEPTTTLVFGSDRDEVLAGFAIVPRDNPVPGDPVEFGFAGNTDAPLPEASNGIRSAFLARYRAIGNTIERIAVQYVGENAALRLGGFTVDRNGNGYIVGQVAGGNNDNPTGAGIFTTTPGIFLDGDKIRGQDVFIRKYSPTNGLIYSGLLGGNGSDYVGGLGIDPGNNLVNMGSAIAVDLEGNAYVTGVTQSFNFPRTRGVYGEVFTSAPTVFVTKISADASQILYSTNLRSQMYPNANRGELGGTLLPSGIAVDAAGNAYVSGMAHPNYVNFPDSFGGTPGDPNEPNGAGFPVIPLQGALDGTYESPATPEFPTTEGWLTVLNQTATDVLLSTWIGGLLDEMVYGPYVDRFGDVWVMGSIDSARGYVRVSSTGTPNVRQQDGAALPAGLISPLAFKSVPEQSGGQSASLLYGDYAGNFGSFTRGVPLGGRVGPARITPGYARDGFVVKLRVATASISAVQLNPSTIPGGLGARSTGTVVLSGPAPAGGADVEVSLNNTSAASLSETAALGSTIVTIPAGATTGTFTVFSSAVTTNTAVQVRATYLGSFQIAQLNVVPWLQDLSITPNILVGGNIANGRITLAAPAPAEGVTVNLSTDTTSLVSFPNGAAVTVPAGQTSVAFPIQTQGVATRTFPNVSASLLGVNRSQKLTLTTAKLLSLTFDPPVVAGRGTTTGTLTLDGRAGSTFTVALTGLPAGYTVTPSTLTFNAGDTQKTFTVTTPVEPTRIDRIVTATRAASGGPDGYLASSVQGTFTVTTAALKSISVAPNPVSGGANVNLTVELVEPAPTGGVVVLLQGDPNVISLPETITIPAGASTRTIVVPTLVIADTTTTEIRAVRDQANGDFVSTNLTVQGAVFAISLDPGTVVGGQQNSVGTVTLANAAGPAGITVNITSSDPSVTVNPTSVFIPAGQRTGTFAITTTAVDVNKTVTISGRIGNGTPVTANLTVRAVGVASVTLSPNRIRGGSTVRITIRLDAPAKAGGATVTLSATNRTLFGTLPATVQVPAGQTEVSFTVTTRRVSRTLTSTVTAATGGSGSSATLTVLR